MSVRVFDTDAHLEESEETFATVQGREFGTARRASLPASGARFVGGEVASGPVGRRPGA
jgi:hypothetical protein